MEFRRCCLDQEIIRRSLAAFGRISKGMNSRLGPIVQRHRPNDIGRRHDFRKAFPISLLHPHVDGGFSPRPSIENAIPVDPPSTAATDTVIAGYPVPHSEVTLVDNDDQRRHYSGLIEKRGQPRPFGFYPLDGGDVVLILKRPLAHGQKCAIQSPSLKQNQTDDERGRRAKH